jgi:hypothetical protein
MNATGTIVKKNNKFITLDNGVGYSVWDANDLAAVNVGDTVEFVYYSKQSGDKTYNNIKGAVTVTGSDPKAATAATSRGGSGGGGSFDESSIPLDRQRSIIRQTCIKAAADVIDTEIGEDVEDIAKKLIGLAERLEAYCAGDDDLAAAEAMLSNSADGAVPAGATPEVAEQFKKLLEEAKLQAAEAA